MLDLGIVNQLGPQWGGHSEGAGYHNFLHFLDSDGNFSFLVAKFFRSTFEKIHGMCIFSKVNQKIFGN